MEPNFVILSHREDEHSLAVLSSLSLKARPFLLDIGKTGSDFVVTRSAQGAIRLRTKRGLDIDFGAVKLWWNRRPAVVGFEDADPRYLRAQEAELEEFWLGTLGYGLPGVWCNPFDAQRLAQNKIRQFHVAKSFGLLTPETIWTNDPSDVLAFRDRHGGNVIFKMFTGSRTVWQPCRRFDEDFLRHIQHVRFQPAIFQQYISGRYEFRTTIFGNHCFSACADLAYSRFPSDVRIDLALERTAGAIDEATEIKLRSFMQAFGLSYATFDLRENSQGELVFLECNPMGQFLYLDGKFKGAMLRAFCSFIEGHLAPSDESDLDSGSAMYSKSLVDFDATIRVPIYESANSWLRHIAK